MHSTIGNLTGGDSRKKEEEENEEEKENDDGSNNVVGVELIGDIKRKRDERKISYP
jgi:hypothetical protein